MSQDLKLRVEALEAALIDVTERLANLERAASPRARGPKTDRAMTEADAFRVKFGDLKGLNHKEAAEKVGLSYGQVFSCRGGYTFKHVKANWTPKTDDAAPEAGEG